MRTIATIVLLSLALSAFADSHVDLCSNIGDCRKKIHSIITDNWEPPAAFSVANVAKVSVTLSTQVIGEIESVEIIESSGSVAFDKTAIEAFSKTGTLLTLKGLENSEYRDFFRKFIIQFEAEGPPVPGVGLSDEEFVNSLPSHNGHIQ